MSQFILNSHTYEVQPTFSIEGMLGFGLGDASVSASGNLNGSKLKINNLFGIYAKPKYQFSPNLEGFLRVGIANGSGTMSYNGISASTSISSFSAGVGMSYAIDKKLSVNIDAMSYYNKNTTAVTGMTVGLGYKF
jgi:opacity protein-like surface antigen